MDENVPAFQLEFSLRGGQIQIFNSKKLSLKRGDYFTLFEDYFTLYFDKIVIQLKCIIVFAQNQNILRWRNFYG